MRSRLTLPPAIGPVVKEEWTLFPEETGHAKETFSTRRDHGKLRHAKVLLGQGKRAAEVVKALGVAEVTYYRARRTAA